MARSALRKMRDARGLTAEQAAGLIAAELGRKKPYHYSTIIKAETKGIESMRLINAYAAVYKQSPEDVFAAASS